jgi:hypothetical protein
MPLLKIDTAPTGSLVVPIALDPTRTQELIEVQATPYR